MVITLQTSFARARCAPTLPSIKRSRLSRRPSRAAFSPPSSRSRTRPRLNLKTDRTRVKYQSRLCSSSVSVSVFCPCICYLKDDDDDDDDDEKKSVLLRQMVFRWERGKVKRERDRHREAESHRDGAEDNEKKNFPK